MPQTESHCLQGATYTAAGVVVVLGAQTAEQAAESVATEPWAQLEASIHDSDLILILPF